RQRAAFEANRGELSASDKSTWGQCRGAVILAGVPAGGSPSTSSSPPAMSCVTFVGSRASLRMWTLADATVTDHDGGPSTAGGARSGSGGTHREAARCPMVGKCGQPPRSRSSHQRVIWPEEDCFFF